MFPRNRTLTDVRTAADHEAFVRPAKPEIKAMLDVPSTKVFSATIEGIVDIKEQDVIVSADPAEKYVVFAVEQFDTDPRVAHTHLILEARWGA